KVLWQSLNGLQSFRHVFGRGGPVLIPVITLKNYQDMGYDVLHVWTASVCRNGASFGRSAAHERIPGCVLIRVPVITVNSRQAKPSSRENSSRLLLEARSSSH